MPPTTTPPTPTPPPSKTPSPKPTVAVDSLSVALRAGTSAGQATVSLKVTGGEATVVLEWFLGDSEGDLRVADGSSSVTTQGGAVPPQTHAFTRGRGCYLSVRVTTVPAAGNKSATATQYIPRCQVQQVPR